MNIEHILLNNEIPFNENDSLEKVLIENYDKINLEDIFINNNCENYKCYDILRALLKNKLFKKMIVTAICNDEVRPFNDNIWETFAQMNFRGCESLEEAFMLGLNLGNYLSTKYGKKANFFGNKENEAYIVYSKKIHFFRAFSLLMQHLEKSKKELFKAKEQNNKQISIIDERTRMSKVNSFENKAITTFGLSVFGYLPIFLAEIPISLYLLISTPSKYKYVLSDLSFNISIPFTFIFFTNF